MSLFKCHVDTSRQSRPGEIHGKDYFFDTRDQMEADIAAGKYIEHGEYRGNLYGTSVDGIRDFVQAGYQPIISPHYQARANDNSIIEIARAERVAKICRILANFFNSYLETKQPCFIYFSLYFILFV